MPLRPVDPNENLPWSDNTLGEDARGRLLEQQIRDYFRGTRPRPPMHPIEPLHIYPDLEDLERIEEYKVTPFPPETDNQITSLEEGDQDMKQKVNKANLPATPVAVNDKNGDLAIEYILFTFDATVVFGIISQTEKWIRGPRDEAKRFKATGFLDVVSSNFVEINPSRIIVRGAEQSAWFDIVTYRFANYRDADAWVEKAHAALANWAKNL